MFPKINWKNFLHNEFDTIYGKKYVDALIKGVRCDNINDTIDFIKWVAQKSLNDVKDELSTDLYTKQDVMMSRKLLDVAGIYYEKCD